MSVANNTELTEKSKGGLSMPTASENTTAMADLTAEKTRKGLSLAAGEEKESLAVTKCTETERAPKLTLSRTEKSRNGLSLANEQQSLETRQGAETDDMKLSPNLPDQPVRTLQTREERQAEIHPTDSQPVGREDITCIALDRQAVVQPTDSQLDSSDCRNYNTQKKLFQIFKQPAIVEITKRLDITEPIQPLGRPTLEISSLKKLCEVTLKDSSRMVKSLKEICSEKVRNLLCGKMDTPETKEKLKEDCYECGPGIHDEDKETYLIGSDVVALFPSIKSMSTGLIVRKRVEKSNLKFPGFKYRQGARYIVMNEKYTGDLLGLRSVLPRRRKRQGSTPSMTGKAVNDRSEEDDGEHQWVYPAREPTDKQKKMIISRCCEIGVRMVFENFTYKFGGQTYKQMEGRPIGARLTMCAARLVMMEWAEIYNNILAAGGDEPELLEVYVDDGRQAGKVFRLGTRFDPTLRKLVITEEAIMEDMRLGEDHNTRMARVCMPIMNSVNPDLVFTVETPEEFEQTRLPTLDVKLWLERGEIRHTYFEKPMKTPFLLMKRSAMSQHQRCAILANELVRRLSNIDVENIPHSEVIKVIEQFTLQLKNSEYSCKEARGHVIDGIRGWKNKIERRKRDKMEFYRLAKNTLHSRVRKKLLEKETWYKNENKKKEEDKPEDWEVPEGWRQDRQRGEKRKSTG